MPIYFNDVAPFCPISRDQPVGLERAPTIRTTIPRAHDLASAIAAVNIARSIITSIVFSKTINNIHTPPPPRPPKDPQDKVIDKRRHSRWTQSKPVKRKYKYFGTLDSGEKDKDTWVTTERVERIAWKDSGWKTSMEFVYGDKGEGEPLDGGGASQSGSDNDMDPQASPPQKDTEPVQPEQAPEAPPPPDGLVATTVPELYPYIEEDEYADERASLPYQPQPEPIAGSYVTNPTAGDSGGHGSAFADPGSQHHARYLTQYYYQPDGQQYLAPARSARTAKDPKQRLPDVTLPGLAASWRRNQNRLRLLQVQER